jgi:small-conductance mechanosensitive channel
LPASHWLSHSRSRVGDMITLPEKNITGTVQEITFRHTVLQTIENTEMIIPNSLDEYCCPGE